MWKLVADIMLQRVPDFDGFQEFYAFYALFTTFK